MTISSYKNLQVWQDAMDLSTAIYSLLAKLPDTEKFALADQMRRAVISIPSNIAEGHSRYADKEFIHFLKIAQASRAEVETQLELCVRVGYFTREQVAEAEELLNKVARKINALKLSLEKKQDNK